MQHADYRSAVLAAGQALRELHGGLIVAARRQYEDDNETASTPTALFKQLTDNPAYAWLAPLTSLVTRLDHLPADAELTAEDVAAVRRQMTQLISPAEGDDTFFYDQLYAARRFAPELVVLHAHARAALGRLVG